MTRPDLATFDFPADPAPAGRHGLHAVLLAACVAAVAGCSTVEGALSGDKVDYRSSPTRAQPLDVPPDLTQLSRDNRFQPQPTGVVAASTFQGGPGSAAGTPATATATAPAGRPATTPTTTPVVAPTALGAVRLERSGEQRWLVTPASPEQLWPQLQAFWREAGFTLEVDESVAGVMETNWAENRAKLPQDAIRRTLGRLVEGFYSTGERDRFRTRLERTAAGTEIYVTHRGLEEVYTDSQRTSTAWTARPRDPELEAVFLARLMTRLGAPAGAAPPAQVAAAATPAAPVAPARARVLEGQPGAALQVDDAFDRAWRRVGLALDRTGYTVEDRDRTQGLYFVRVVPAKAPAEGGFLSRLFGGDTKEPSPERLRVAVKGDTAASVVSIQNAQGAADGSDTARRIVSLLVDDLK
jgi:outer membrane protein assembly factor BamC